MGTERVPTEGLWRAPNDHARLDRPVNATFDLWGIDWSERLPLLLTDDGIELVASKIESALPFIESHYAEIFEQDRERDRFYAEPFEGPKMRSMQAADVFEVRHRDRTVGAIIGAPSDWSTYYIRSIGFLRAYQGRNLPWKIFPFLFRELAAAGARRVEAETSPSNLATVLILTRMHFNLTGNVLTERWGALLRLTKFLDPQAEEVFLHKFCSGIRYQRRDPSAPTSKERSSP